MVMCESPPPFPLSIADNLVGIFKIEKLLTNFNVSRQKLIEPNLFFHIYGVKKYFVDI